MAHLLELYSRMTGLKINEMPIATHHYPLGVEGKYVVFVASTGMSAKNYSYYSTVVSFMKEYLHKHGYAIVQAGNGDDERIGADVDACGQTSIKQFAGIIKHAELVVCGDTSALHIAGAFNRKLVSLFAITHPHISGAFFGEPANQIYLTPQGDWRPSFSPNDSQSIINSIAPERVVAAIGELLKIDVPRFHTLYIGKNFTKSCIELIPDMEMPSHLFPNAGIQVRLDKGGDAQQAVSTFTRRKGVLITEVPVPIAALHAVRGNLDAVVYIVTKNSSPEFPQELQQAGIPVRLASFLSEAELNKVKLDYADIGVIHRETPPSQESLGIKTTPDTRFTTYRRIFSQNRIFLSHGHVVADKSVDRFAQSEDTILTNEEFWRGAEFYHIYNYT